MTKYYTANVDPSRLIVVGSADFATDLMTMTDSGYNATFVANAAEEVIEEARENLAAREEEAAKMVAALKRLAELG